MAGLAELTPPAALLAAMAFAVLVASYKVLERLQLNHMMRKLASELALNYSQTVPTRPPSVNGFYRGRDVVVDVSDDTMRLRVFHASDVGEPFTVGPKEYFSENNIPGARSIDVGDEEFERDYRIAGGTQEDIRKYVNENVRSLLKAESVPFTVGKHEIHHSADAERDAVKNHLNYLVEVTKKAQLL